jgi:hypothetical protein
MNDGLAKMAEIRKNPNGRIRTSRKAKTARYLTSCLAGGVVVERTRQRLTRLKVEEWRSGKRK